MGRTLDKRTGGRHLEMTRIYKESFVDGGKICNKCDLVKKLDEYHNNHSICKFCKSEIEKKKYKKSQYKLW